MLTNSIDPIPGSSLCLSLHTENPVAAQVLVDKMERIHTTDILNRREVRDQEIYFPDLL